MRETNWEAYWASGVDTRTLVDEGNPLPENRLE